MHQQRPLIDWFGILALAVLWGTSFLFVKIAVREVPPLTMVAARFVIAASVLGVAVRARGLRLPTSRRVWSHYLLMSLIGNSIPFTLIAWGQIRVDVGLAGILMGVMPLMTLLLAHFFVPGERMTPRMAGGFAVGFIGLVALFGPEALLEFGGESSDLLSQLAIGLAAICYATNTIITRRLGTLDPLVSATTVMWITTAIMVPLALWVERPWNLAWSADVSIADQLHDPGGGPGRGRDRPGRKAGGDRLDRDGADPDRPGDQSARKPNWLGSPGLVDLLEGAERRAPGTRVFADRRGRHRFAARAHQLRASPLFGKKCHPIGVFAVGGD